MTDPGLTARLVSVTRGGQCTELGHNTITPEHVLLGLLRENEGVGIRILRESDLDPEQIRTAVLEQMPGPHLDPPHPPVRSARRTPAGPDRSGLGFMVAPSEQAERVLVGAGARALTEGRTEFTVMDLLFALGRDPEAAREMVRAAGDLHLPTAGDSPEPSPSE